MTSKRFFISSAEVTGCSIELRGDEHYHLSRVVRLRRGARVTLFNEKGCPYLACVENICRESTRLRIIEEKAVGNAGFRIFLAQAMVKSRKMEMILQKGTELGVTAFIPLITRRTVIDPGQSSGKMARWQRILRETMKQCGRTDMPEIRKVMSLSEFLGQGDYGQKVFLWEREGIPLKELLCEEQAAKALKPGDPDSVALLVGPEGGWTEEEYQRIMDHGYTAVTLGRNVLRSETAAIAGVAMIAHFWNL